MAEELKIFKAIGAIKHDIDPRTGAGHWTVSHPAAKIVQGIVSGRRWVSDKVHGGKAKARAVAHGILQDWKEGFDSEILRRERIDLILCAKEHCMEKGRGMVDETMNHLHEWKVVKGSSLEHSLQDLAMQGETMEKSRRSEIKAKSAKARKTGTADSQGNAGDNGDKH